MQGQIEKIRNQQKETWNNFSPGWRKWDDIVMNFLSPIGKEMIRLIHPQDEQLILDIAGGTGEPGLSIAKKLRKGKVVITDIAAGMLEIAKENASRRGITNVDTVVCDVSELPFDDNSFDAITCRMGFMFFPDMELAAREMVRVLKPGGTITVSVWNTPEKNPWITVMTSIIQKHLQLPQQPPDAPGMFRGSMPGLVENIFRRAGLQNIGETQIDGKLYIDSATTFWIFHTEVAAPVGSTLNEVDERTRRKVRREVFDTINERYPDGDIGLDYSAIVIYGEK